MQEDCAKIKIFIVEQKVIQAHNVKIKNHRAKIKAKTYDSTRHRLVKLEHRRLNEHGFYR